MDNIAGGGNGGAVFIVAPPGPVSSVNVTASSFVNNTATDFDGDGGGALFVAESTLVTLLTSNFTSNASFKDGGGVFIDDNFGNVDVTGCTFQNNTADDEGGALKIVAVDPATTNVTVTDSNFRYDIL